MISTTYIIIGVTALISFFVFNNNQAANRLIFYPYEIKRERDFFRFISHGFIHANWTHLLFNMITLFFFGPIVENYLQIHFGKQQGLIIYISMYILGIIISAIPSYFKHQNNQFYRSLGASGAVSAILFASILIRPTMIILVYFIPIPALLFAPLYLIYSAYMAKRGRDNIGHDAHFVGAIFGLIILLLLIPATFGRFLEQVIGAFQ